MQRFASILLVLSTGLYGACANNTTPRLVKDRGIASPAVQTPLPRPLTETYPVVIAPATPPAVPGPAASAPLSPPPPVEVSPKTTSRIALLLPLKSPSFARPAEMVKQGFMVAMSPFIQTTGASVSVYASTDKETDILTLYQQAITDGHHVIVGPLTKNAVSALAGSRLVSVPTLTLNVPDNEISAPANFYLFGLSVENEAQQVARLAYRNGLRSANIVLTNSPLSRRMLTAFSTEWQKLGGRIVAQLEFVANPQSLARLKETALQNPADMFFLATDATQARLVRPYLDNAIPTFATSQIYGGLPSATANLDLEGVRFLDIPWIVQPTHAAVMVYPKLETEDNVELERFYALGIDAARLSLLLASGSRPNASVIDGVTGQISLSTNHQFTRELSEAEFREGLPRLRAP